MGPNADRAIQLLRDAADDLEPREAYVFEPEGPVEGVAHFIGGAALGTFPQVAYKALLTRVAQRCGVAVVATPFDLGLDHDAAARTCRVAFRAEAARWRGLPRYGIGHSLGAKLLLLIACDDADANCAESAWPRIMTSDSVNSGSSRSKSTISSPMGTNPVFRASRAHIFNR